MAPSSGKTVAGWLVNRASQSLERAYRAAQRLKTLEERYGRPWQQTLADDPAKARYLQGILDRQLLAIRVNMMQFQIFHFWANQNELSWEEEQNLLQKLAFIENIVTPYRRSETPAPPVRQHQNVPTSGTATSRRANQASGSFFATVNEIGRELQPGYEEQVVQEIRLFRQQGRTAIRFLCILLIIPLVTQMMTKHFIFTPFLDHFVNVNPERARPFLRDEIRQETIAEFVRYKEAMEFTHLIGLNPEFSTKREEALQEKALEIFKSSAYRAVDGLANLLADLSGLLAFVVVARWGRNQFPVLWGFGDRFFRGLNDPTKVFIFILVTDLFVGFHSAEGWEVLLETLSLHFGVTPNRSVIYTFIATVPVILDSAIKFWIFNYLSRSSPSSVAVLEKMNQ